MQSYARGVIFYAGISYVVAIVILFAGTGFASDVPPPNTPNLVDRADGWPESKAKHQEPGDLFSILQRVHFSDSYEWLYESRSDYRAMEIWVWCLLLPLAVGLAIGSVVARHHQPSWATTGGLVLLLASGIYGLSFVPVPTIYSVLWDASIQWANLLGITYYDLNVGVFIALPLFVLTGCVAYHITWLISLFVSTEW